jgi:hypothetical protein
MMPAHQLQSLDVDQRAPGRINADLSHSGQFSERYLTAPRQPTSCSSCFATISRPDDINQSGSSEVHIGGSTLLTAS